MTFKVFRFTLFDTSAVGFVEARRPTVHGGQPGIYRLPGSCRPVQAVYPMQYGTLTPVLSGLMFPSLTILYTAFEILLSFI